MTHEAQVSGSKRAMLLVSVLVLSIIGGQAFAVLDDSVTSPLDQALTVRPPWAPDSVTVRFKDGLGTGRATDLISGLACSVGYRSVSTPNLVDIKIPAGKSVQEMIAEFARRGDVLSVEPTYIDYPADLPAFAPNDPLYGNQWHMTMIGAPTAWDRVGGGFANTVVAVIDTGVAFENYVDGADTYVIAPDLDGTTFVHPRNIIAGNIHPNDDDHHGTHVAGTVAQRTNNGLGVAGVAYNARIMPIKVLGTGGGSHAQFSDGVHWAVDHGAHIINYSAGGSHSTTKHDAVKYAETNGVLFIAAMGNDSSGTAGSRWPGEYPEAIGVMAVDIGKDKAFYSNWGTGTDVAAPGGETATPSNGVLQNTFAAGDPTDFDYYYFQGTSMATPHVSGLAALLWGQAGYTTAAAVRSRIQSTTEDLGAAGFDTTYGWGLIQADVAVPNDGKPVLTWAGTSGYTSDGVAPDSGDPNSTEYVFRVKYANTDGDAPTKRYLKIWRLDDDGWQVHLVKKMSEMAGGSYTTGKIYTATTKLDNHVYKHTFDFADTDGPASGNPTTNHLGPKVRGPAFLSWSGATGYNGVDGVNPNSGPPDTKFYFRVVYRDSWGSPPTTARVQIRRDGKVVDARDMNDKGGDYQTGRVYQVRIRLKRPLSHYEYRFRFDDGAGWASGAPAEWTSGPDTTADGGALFVSGLSAAPTSTGAQVNFSLSTAANVTATVANIAGRPIRTIASDSPMDAGANTLIWNRVDDRGLSVPSGTYTVRIEARTTEGAQTSSVTTVPIR